MKSPLFFLKLVILNNQYDQMSHNSRESNRFFAPICDFDPQLPPNGEREGGNDMIKYFGYKCLVNRPLIIEIYENALGNFYCLLHTVRVKNKRIRRPLLQDELEY